MMAIGETLRRERVRRNLNLDQISRETKISPKMLEAIETEQFQKLPGNLFAKSFVRQYARALGLDEDEFVSEVERIIAPLPPPTAEQVRAREALLPDAPIRMHQWESISDPPSRFNSLLPSFAWVVAVMLACSGAYWWLQNRSVPRDVRETTAHNTQPVTPPAAAQVQPIASNPAPAAASSSPQSSAPENPVSGSSGHADRQNLSAASQAPANPAPAKPTADLAQPAVPSPKPALGGGSVNLRLTAEEPTWVLVRKDGQFLFSGTLAANETRDVTANGDVTVRLGNAGTIAVTLNGKPLGAVGPKGQVRTVQFTSGGFQTVAAPVSKPPSTLSFDPL